MRFEVTPRRLKRYAHEGSHILGEGWYWQKTWTKLFATSVQYKFTTWTGHRRGGNWYLCLTLCVALCEH